MNRDQFLQRAQRNPMPDAQASEERASAPGPNHRQQAQRSADLLDEELARLANLYSPTDLVNRGAQ